MQAAQEQYVKADPAAAIVTETERYGYSDPFHYDTAGYIDLGRRFADAVMKLSQEQKRRSIPTSQPQGDKPADEEAPPTS